MSTRLDVEDTAAAGVSNCRNFIGGGWQQAHATSWFDVTNSSTGEIVARTPLSGAKDVDLAVTAAAKAFFEWSRIAVSDRVQVLFSYKSLLEAGSDQIARCITIENGKTLDEARAEVQRGIGCVELACGAPMMLKGQTLDGVGGLDYQTARCPMGVCVGIGAFNFPLLIPHWMFPMAIACGNTFVFKPSEQTPLTSLACVELLRRAGLPPGVMNIVHGGAPAVEAMLAHPEVAAVSFVGSTPVARQVYRAAAAHGKRVQAEGSAKNHLVVMPDATRDRAIEDIISSAFGSAGARCMAVATVIAVGDAGGWLAPRLKQAAAGLRVGRTDLDGRPDMGPLVSNEHRTRIIGCIERAEREGAVLALDGRKLKESKGLRGFFLGPTIFDRVQPGHALATEEVFGPVLGIVRAPTLDQAIRHINASLYGNAASIYTHCPDSARQFRERVQAGMVGINVSIPAPIPCFPFSGWKDSFFGDLHVQGAESMAFYTREKVVSTRWL